MLFRLHLKANKVPGLEKAYLQYTLLVDVIEKGTFSNGDNASEVSSSSPSIHRILMRSRSMGASQGADAALLEAPLLEEEMGAGWQQSTESERRALMVSRLLWVELQRVDAFCRETVQDMEFLANHISNQLASQREANLLVIPPPSLLVLPLLTELLRSQERRATLEHTLAVCELMESNARQSQDNALRLMYKNCFLMMQVTPLPFETLLSLQTLRPSQPTTARLR